MPTSRRRTYFVSCCDLAQPACAMRGSGVARFRNFVHLRPMSGQNAMRSEIRTKPNAMDGAPLKLEQFLPYQLNVVATLVSEALSRVYARRYRIGIPEWRVLVTLASSGS